MRFNIATILVFCLSCGNNDKLEGVYEGFWGETSWVLLIKSNQKFEFSSDGHLSTNTYSGQYTLRADTLILNTDTNNIEQQQFLIAEDGCLVDIETRYDYCKDRGSNWAGDLRNIKYPQLALHAEKRKGLVQKMIQKAIDKIDPVNINDSTIYLAEYFEVTKVNGYQFFKDGKVIHLLPKDEIQERQVLYHLNIEYFNIGRESALLQFSVAPYYKTINAISINYEKIDGKWVHKDYF